MDLGLKFPISTVGEIIIDWNYLGAGAGLGSRSFHDHDHNGHDHDDDSDFFALVAGDVGIEYNFDFPLLLSLDFRPELGLDDYGDDVDFDIALGIRYTF